MKRILIISISLLLSMFPGCRDNTVSSQPESTTETANIVSETTEATTEAEVAEEHSSEQFSSFEEETEAAPEEESWLASRTFRLSSHRGATPLAPENTIEAVKRAISCGYGAVELDPRRSADGVIYLMHDDTVSRTTDGTGKIERMTSREIDALRIDTDGYPEYRGSDLRVALFEDAVKELSGHDIVLNVDCSKGNWEDEDYIDQVMGILEKYKMAEKSFFVISDRDSRRLLHRKYPQACVSWLYKSSHDIEDEIEAIKEYPKALLSVKDKYASDRIIRKLNDSSIYYQIYAVDDYDRLEYLKDKGVPMVETDDLLP